MTEYIKKDSAVDEIEGWIDAYDNNSDTHVISRRALMHAKRSIEKLYAEDVVPVRRGHWIRHENADVFEGYEVPMFECSECRVLKEDDSDFCPDCGSYNGGENEV